VEHIVYLVTCTATGKRYVGRTSRPLGQRAYSHFWGARYRGRRPTEFHRDLVLYGEQAFRFEVIATAATIADLHAAECAAIDLYKPEYNRKIGASGQNPRVLDVPTKRSVDSDLDGEVWRPVVEFDGKYEVSDQGRVRSVIPRGRTKALLVGVAPRRRVLKQTLDPRGYPCVYPQFCGRKHTRRVHVLVAEAFIGPRGPGVVTRHKNGDYADPRLDNLCYGTMADNMADRGKHGRTARGGDRHGKAKLTAEMVRNIRDLRGFHTIRELGRMFGVTHQSIQQVVSGKSWGHVE
jgi:hypothetical protein